MKTNYLIPETYVIMIVDDEDIVRLITRVSLENYGYKVIDFANPLHALEYYQNHYRDIDVVILDMIMPILNGDALFYKLKEINPYLVACVLSGYDDVEIIYQHLLNEGLYCFIHKPVNNELINIKVWEMLRTHQSINIDKGLSLIMNNEKVYLKLLKVYIEEYGNLEIQFNELIKQDKYEEIDNIIHKIKGIAMNLGAVQCYNMASSLHQKHHNNDMNLNELSAFVKYHNYLIKDIERILGAQIV